MKKALSLIALLATSTALHAAPFDGIYVGLNAGVAHHNMKIKFYQSNGTPAGMFKTDKSSFVYGGQVGYAVSFANHIYTAAEVNFVSQGRAAHKQVLNPNNDQTRLTNLAKGSGAIAVKAGYNFDRGIAYVGGFVGKRAFRTTIDGVGAIATVYHNTNATIYGPVLGAELKVFGHFTAGVEGRIEITKRTKRLQEQASTSHMKPRGSVVLARLNYAF